MWQIVAEPAGLTADVRRGLRDALTTINRQGAFFDPGRDLTLARAPGRLDLMGGIADYSGALVLQWPLAIATWVAAQVVDEPVIRIRSPGAAALGDAGQVEWPLAWLLPRQRALTYAEARAALTGDPRRRWRPTRPGRWWCCGGRKGPNSRRESGC
jgi:galactokinase